MTKRLKEDHDNAKYLAEKLHSIKEIEVDLANDIVFKGIRVYGVVGRLIYDTWYQVKDLIDNAIPGNYDDKIVTPSTVKGVSWEDFANYSRLALGKKIKIT